MRKIIAIISLLMLIGEQGNLELGAELTTQSIIKSIILLLIFVISARKINEPERHG